MATNTCSAFCSPQAVFDVLADGWLYPSWVVGASRIRAVDEDWPAAGAKLYHSFGVWPALIDDSTSALVWDPSRRMELKARGWPMGSAKVVLEVQPSGDGCQISIQEDAIEGPGTLIPKPLRDALISIRNVETLRRLTFLAEGAAGARQADHDPADR